MGKTWAVASGIGGAGKTTIALSLAIGAAQRGLSTILLDAGGIARSCDLVLGIESMMTIDLVDALSQQPDIASALYPVPTVKNLRLANASLYGTESLHELTGIILVLQSMCDVLVIDLATGALPFQNGVLTRGDEVIFVARPDDVSMRATERLMQQTRGSETSISLVLNHVKRDKQKKGLQYTNEAVSISLDCPLLGAVAEDDDYVAQIVSGKALRGIAHWFTSNPMKEILNELLDR